MKSFKQILSEMNEDIQDKKAKAAAYDVLANGMSMEKAIIKYGVSPKKLEKLLKDMKKDLDMKEENLSEATKTVDDFMKLFSLKKEPKKGTRLVLDGYPMDYDGFEEDEIYLNAVDVDAAKGAEKTFKKKGWNVLRVGDELTLDVSK